MSLKNPYTGGLPYSWVIHSKTYHGYGKPWIMSKAIYKVISDIRVSCINTVKFN